MPLGMGLDPGGLVVESDLEALVRTGLCQLAHEVRCFPGIVDHSPVVGGLGRHWDADICGNAADALRKEVQEIRGSLICQEGERGFQRDHPCMKILVRDRASEERCGLDVVQAPGETFPKQGGNGPDAHGHDDLGAKYGEVSMEFRFTGVDHLAVWSRRLPGFLLLHVRRVEAPDGMGHPTIPFQFDPVFPEFPFQELSSIPAKGVPGLVVRGAWELRDD
jgi:hypothetical protein